MLTSRWESTRSLLQIVWILSRNFVDIFRLNSLVGSYLLLRISLGCVYDMLNAQCCSVVAVVVLVVRWWTVRQVPAVRLHSAQSLSAAHTANITSSCSAAVPSVNCLLYL